MDESKANEKQVGGDHYRRIPGEQHWDRMIRLQLDPFQYVITKYVERWKDKNGVEDLEKARHFLDKYIENWPAFQRPPKQTSMYEFDNLAEAEVILDGLKARYDFEGIYGNPPYKMFTCVRCRTTIKAKSIFHAHGEHGDCAGRSYVDQNGGVA